MSEKSLTEMTDDEIIAEIQALRDRRAQVRERRNVAPKEKKVVESTSDSVWDSLMEEET